MKFKEIKKSIKTIILCGGFGTRLAEETKLIPKPMVKIGKKPILEHIINFYNMYGFNNFILSCGYKAKIIKDYFKIAKNKKNLEIQSINTGLKSMTGGRILKLKKFFKKDEVFMVTYGDGLSNINLDKLLKFHLKHKKIATMTIVRPPARFGIVEFDNKKIIKKFEEKPQVSEGWVNGGFFIFDYRIFKYIKKNNQMLEKYTFKKLVELNQLVAYEHTGYWQCMDTLRDKIFLNKIWKTGKAPWIKK